MEQRKDKPHASVTLRGRRQDFAELKVVSGGGEGARRRSTTTVCIDLIAGTKGSFQKPASQLGMQQGAGRRVC